MNDAFDDLGTAQKPYKVVACMPVYGRLPLLELTIKRLYSRNQVYKVICSGDGPEERELCESHGALWVQAENKPLGLKWNKAFQAAKSYDPAAVLYVGSSDWISDNWIPTMRPLLERYDFVGTAGCHFLHVGEGLRACFWRGYKFTPYHKTRSDETIGIGRMLSKSLMDKINWTPFGDNIENSLDRSMKDRCKKVGIDDYMVEAEIKALSISTDKWVNKHNFNNEYASSKRVHDVQMFVNVYFPEINKLCSVL